MKFFTKEVRIAIVAIVGIVVLFYGLEFLKGLTVFSTDDSYYIEFDDVSGLSASSPVYANGYRVGVVKEIKYDYSHQKKIIAVMGLDNKMSLPKGTRAEIDSDLLGNIKINLVLGDNPIDLLAEGDTISGGAVQGVMAKVGAMMPALETMMPKLDSILTSLNTLLADPAIPNSLHHIDQVTGDLTTTTRQLNTMMAQHHVEGMTDNLSATSRELKTLSASLNREMPAMMQKTNGVLDNTQQLTANLAAIDVAAMTASVNQTLANVNEMTRKLNSNEGSLGLLMRDATLYNRLSQTVADADSLMVDLKAHPKRYVHFSVFGRKDK